MPLDLIFYLLQYGSDNNCGAVLIIAWLLYILQHENLGCRLCHLTQMVTLSKNLLMGKLKFQQILAYHNISLWHTTARIKIYSNQTILWTRLTIVNSHLHSNDNDGTSDDTQQQLEGQWLLPASHTAQKTSAAAVETRANTQHNHYAEEDSSPSSSSLCSR